VRVLIPSLSWTMGRTRPSFMGSSDYHPKPQSAGDGQGSAAPAFQGSVESEARRLPSFAWSVLLRASELRARLEEAGAWTDPARSNRMLRAVIIQNPGRSDKHMLSGAIPCDTEQHLGRKILRQVADRREMPGCPPTKTDSSR
jgi:hypothetical protein